MAPRDSRPHIRSIRKARPNPLGPAAGSNMPAIASAGSVVGAAVVAHGPVGGNGVRRPSPPCGSCPWPLRWSPCRARSESRRRSAGQWRSGCCRRRVRRRPAPASAAGCCTWRCRCSPAGRLRGVTAGGAEMKAVAHRHDAGAMLGGRATAMSMACSPVSWPKALPASSTTQPPRSETTVALSRGLTEPSCSRSTYMSTSITPCDGSPERSASTRPSATEAAAFSPKPAATKIRPTRAASSAAGTAAAGGAGEGGVVMGPFIRPAACARRWPPAAGIRGASPATWLPW